MDSIRFEPKLHNPSHRKEKKGGGAHLEVAGHRLRKGSGSSTTARPLDGGTLHHGRTRAPARGTAAAPLWPPQADVSPCSPLCAADEKGKEKRTKSRRPMHGGAMALSRGEHNGARNREGGRWRRCHLLRPKPPAAARGV